MKTSASLQISTLIFVIDQIFKYLSVSGFFYYVKNSGVSFGLFPDYAHLTPILYLGVGFLIWKLGARGVVLGLFIGGALSNSFDRLFYNGVIDYIPIVGSFGNLADISIIASLIILGYDIVRDMSHTLKEAK